MLCCEIMTANPECCWTTESVQQAAARMRLRNVGFLPVLAEGSVLVGTITDRDLAIRILADRRSPHQTTVGEIMSHGVVTCDADEELEIAEERMIRSRKSRIICLDRNGRPAGVLSLSDLAEHDWTWRASNVLREISTHHA